MKTTKKELSYFRLKLEAYLGEHFPEKVNNNASFVTTRADEALIAYCDAVAQGFSHPEAETMASEVLSRAKINAPLHTPRVFQTLGFV